MPRQTFTYRSRINAPAAAVFDWHKRPGAFERVMPPWRKIELLERHGTIDGGTLRFRMKVAGIWTWWQIQHEDYIEGEQFASQQVEGPFTYWRHTHRVEPEDDQACTLIDHVEYELPLGVLGAVLGGKHVRKELTAALAYRHQVLAADLPLHQQSPQPLIIAISGSTGFIGSALIPLLTTGGHRIKRLVRRKPHHGVADAIVWFPHQGHIDQAGLEGVDAVVHLAGESIMGRWTVAKKKRLINSRVEGTRLIAQTLARLDSKPKVLICASAIGFYGDRPGETLTEQSSAGKGFLAEVCKQWEAAAQPAIDAGIRVIHARFGLVLSPRGGALGRMLPPFRAGVAGPLGSGSQIWSWISLEDVTAVLYWAILHDAARGAINVVSPQPVSNQAFTGTLAGVLHRPAVLPAPRFTVRAVIGPFADEGLFASQRVAPEKLDEWGYGFREVDLRTALGKMLGKVL